MTGKGAGRLQIQRAAGFVIDTQAPPPPAITTAPANPSAQTSASLGFADAETGLQFECNLDESAWGACASPTAYRNLSPRVHVFAVRAVDHAGNISAATADAWRVALASAADSTPFTISGSPVGALYPGGPKRPIPLTLHNPGRQPIAVTAVSISLVASSLPAGCRPSDYQITQPVMPGSGLPVAPGTSVTLPTGQTVAPVISMVNTSNNQDACRGARLVLSYTGSASS
jgi:hypothetical protein